jgi:hypothetical protein
VAGSDFATVAIAGLGGLFSQLPSSLPPNLQMKGKRNKYEEEFCDDLDSFMRLLEFIQKITLICPHNVIVDALLRDLRLNFLDNVVLSSIMNGSDFDVCFYLLISLGVDGRLLVLFGTDDQSYQ